MYFFLQLAAVSSDDDDGRKLVAILPLQFETNLLVYPTLQTRHLCNLTMLKLKIFNLQINNQQ